MRQLKQSAFEQLDRLCGGLDDPVGVAVSGGGDSMALLRLAKEWSVARKRSLLALTFDHKLRAESTNEAAFVAEVCKSLGVVHRVLGWSSPKGVQATARRARHAALATGLRQAGGKMLLMGHTPDDQRETLLLRCRQGSGWYGLAATPSFAPSPVWPEGRGVVIARPFIAIGKQAERDQLRDGLRSCNQSWIDDPSNDNRSFERIRVRQMLQTSPELVSRIDKVIAKLQRLRNAEDVRLAGWLGGHVGFDDAAGATISHLISLPQETAIRALSILLQIVSGSDLLPRRAKVEALANALTSPQMMPRRTLHGVNISAKNGKISLQREKAAVREHAAEARIFDNRFERKMPDDLSKTYTFDPESPEILEYWTCLLPERLDRHILCLRKGYEHVCY